MPNEMRNRDRESLLGYAIVGATILAIGFGAVQTYKRYFVDTRIPSISCAQIEDKYVCPEDIQVFSEDFFGDGKRELVFKIKGRSYHLRYEKAKPPYFEEGKPFLKEDPSLYDRTVVR